MHRKTLDIGQLPSWAKLNNIEFSGIAISNIPGKGYGLIVTAERSEDDAILMTVPKDLILSCENVWVLAKADQDLREVLEAVGDYGRTARGAIVIFLLMQITHTGRATPVVAVSNQFTHYVQLLPSHIALPTCWTEEERSTLRGTSLETALEAKLNSLDREFSEFRSATSSIAWCQRTWWDMGTGTLSFEDWKLIDAMYRSRALDLPGTGHSMIPCIDNANHASGDNTISLYETDLDANAILILRDGKDLKRGDEITITYGDEKGACEMLFSYGFIEEEMISARELFLDLDIRDDDPLKLAKKAVSNSAPGFRLFDHDGTVSWEGPFVWLLCINEEDGLKFQLLQKNDGERELKVFWRGAEMSDLSRIATLLKEDPKWPLFELRATAVVSDRVKKQLIILDSSKTDVVSVPGPTKEHTTIHYYAARLRALEESLMLQAYDEWETKIADELFPSDIVQEFLATATQDQSTTTLEDDFHE